MVYIYHVKVSEEDMQILETMQANVETVKNTINDIKKSFPNSWRIPLHKSILNDKRNLFNVTCEQICGIQRKSNNEVRPQYRISPLDSEILIHSTKKMEIQCDKVEVK